MKKKPDLNLPCISALELQGRSSLKVCNNEEKLGDKSSCKMSPNFGQKKVPQNTDVASSTILALGNANFSADCAETKSACLGTCRSSEKVRINGIQFGWFSTITSGSSSKPLSTGSANKTRSWNLSPNSLNNTADACCHIKTDHDLDVVHPNTRMFESLKRSWNSPCVTDDWCDQSPVNTFLSLSLCGSTDESKKAAKRSRVCDTPLLVDQKESGSLCYEPPQLTDFNVPISSGRRTSVDKDIEHASQLFNSYPSNLSLCISSNDGGPESILKSSAMSYRNRPSIIRKKSFSKAANASYSRSLSTPVRIISSASDSKDANSSNLISEKCCLHSKDIKSGSSVIGQALERRLEYAFDLEWDSTTVRCCTPGSPTPSSELKVDTKIMLPP